MIEKIKNYELLSNHVCEAIKKAICEGTLVGGEKVSETELAKMLGVSRTPVREALRLLNNEGYVKLMPNSRVLINEFDEKDAIEVLQVRRALECEAAGMAAAVITDEQKMELINTYNEINKLENMDKELIGLEFVKIDTNFHRKIIEISGNSRMLLISNSLRDRLFRSHVSLAAVENAVQICSDQHKDILNAVIANDSEMAMQYSRKHIDYIIKEVVPNSY
ncbi:GntR family transcriptional regulator [Sedimentibacter hydroxybenzoicus DSM 7310]|uniref:GntR family transcriptional regulator n=1 Tax=Sedimentibacter hydroxybenzoicus DSM 7310 TaxID=1123245 RepID=A0A974GWX1_SEDHY|nr:GntR family transcriptional regulator [Sedimentibacter hydroxybenzoicus]NYB74691.1 GntR family transcriptional regulator [Sedimentibacter hydroxybenzoicus DSM 7310]